MIANAYVLKGVGGWVFALGCIPAMALILWLWTKTIGRLTDHLCHRFWVWSKKREGYARYVAWMRQAGHEPTPWKTYRNYGRADRT